MPLPIPPRRLHLSAFTRHRSGTLETTATTLYVDKELYIQHRSKATSRPASPPGRRALSDHLQLSQRPSRTTSAITLQPPRPLSRSTRATRHEAGIDTSGLRRARDHRCNYTANGVAHPQCVPTGQHPCRNPQSVPTTRRIQTVTAFEPPPPLAEKPRT